MNIAGPAKQTKRTRKPDVSIVVRKGGGVIENDILTKDDLHELRCPPRQLPFESAETTAAFHQSVDDLSFGLTSVRRSPHVAVAVGGEDREVVAIPRAVAAEAMELSPLQLCGEATCDWGKDHKIQYGVNVYKI
ncbi:hypothetical protein CSOJ01_09912 [Colletotrichum sojae]|uniref:Uncharacterized protein n=1 Tax=Colletotrichum sojae TaxID=2175907 RepID=A0A8H6J281_9PEZI|nr:hypothetical protein CSOJ01_09912 [Colletotrichum sojae]